jgi:hypothetical protein
MDQIAYSKSEPMLAYNSKDSQYKYCLCNNQFISYLFNKQIIDKEEITFDCLLDNALPYIKQLTSINKSKEEEPAPYSTKKNKLFMLLKSCTEKKIGLDDDRYLECMDFVQQAQMHIDQTVETRNTTRDIVAPKPVEDIIASIDNSKKENKALRKILVYIIFARKEFLNGLDCIYAPRAKEVYELQLIDDIESYTGNENIIDRQGNLYISVRKSHNRSKNDRKLHSKVDIDKFKFNINRPELCELLKDIESGPLFTTQWEKRSFCDIYSQSSDGLGVHDVRAYSNMEYKSNPDYQSGLIDLMQTHDHNLHQINSVYTGRIISSNDIEEHQSKRARSETPEPSDTSSQETIPEQESTTTIETQTQTNNMMVRIQFDEYLPVDIASKILTMIAEYKH